MTSKTKNKTWILPAVWLAATITILPVIFHWPAPQPHLGADRYVRLWIGYAAIAAISYLIYKVESARLVKPQALALVFLLFLLTCVVNNIHYNLVDHGVSYFGSGITNWEWQSQLEDLVVQLNPQNLPHSYRFLPNAFVRWLQMAHLDFEHSRGLYRTIFGLLLFYSIHRYARLYTNHLASLIAVLLVGAIYPISFEFYGGQLTDPMSHLSFVLALIFIETDNFGLLLATLLIGSLAKETVLAMVGYYVLFCRRTKNYKVKAITLAVTSLAVYVGVRLYVLKGSMGYKQVSGVTLDHVATNWNDARWPTVFLLTGGALLPFFVMGWRTTPKSLKQQAIFLLIVLFMSSLFFSWLAESRNFMPLAFVLAVVSARFLVPARPRDVATPNGELEGDASLSQFATTSR